MLEVQKITTNKEQYLPLLMQSGQSSELLKEKLTSCDLYVLNSGNVCISAVLIESKKDICDIIAIATEISHRKQGYAARLVEYITYDYASKASTLQICLPKASAEPFYRLGFHCDKAQQDMLYMSKDLKELD